MEKVEVERWVKVNGCGWVVYWMRRVGPQKFLIVHRCVGFLPEKPRWWSTLEERRVSLQGFVCSLALACCFLPMPVCLPTLHTRGFMLRSAVFSGHP